MDTDGSGGSGPGDDTMADGTAADGAAAYAERLYPSPGIVLAAAVFAVGCAVTTLPLGTPVALVTLAVVAAGLAALLVRGSAPVAVADGRFVAGPARLPVEVVGAVEALDAAAMRYARGQGLDARAYLCLRGWVSGGVRVHLDDPGDPAPYWLVSSRRPDSLAAALSAAATSCRERRPTV
jgi:hypothetical protein